MRTRKHCFNEVPKDTPRESEAAAVENGADIKANNSTVSLGDVDVPR